jgi:predicted anti-sigma-YlaC factor YlaD
MNVEAVDRHLNVLDLDELDLEPVAPEPRARVEAHARRCSACAERRAAHAALIAQFRASVLPRTVEAVTARRRDRLRRGWWAWLAVPVAAAVLLLVVGRHRAGIRVGGDAGSDLGVKGGALFEVFARRAGAGLEVDGPTVVRVRDGMRLAPGDALRFVLFPSGLPYVLIASVDGAGQVSIYYPFHGEESALVGGAGAIPVPGSIVLDAAPGPERLFVIYSARALQAGTVRAALAPAAAGGAVAIRGTKQAPLEGTVQSSLLFEKEEAR